MRNVDGPRGRGTLARSRFDGSAVALDRDLLREARVRTLLVHRHSLFTHTFQVF